jgi:pimeloyl-ACP methyl ester carboxylesterase
MAFSRSATRLSQQLHTTWIGGNPSSSSSISSSPIVFLHGLLGNGRNVQTMARKFCELKQQSGLLVDIRGHGKSKVATDSTNAHTIKNCAQDVSHTLQQHQQQMNRFNIETTTTMVGHSLGGRLSLQYAYDSLLPKPQRIWLLDTVPGKAFASVAFVLEIAQSFLEGPPVENREEAETILKREFYMDPSTAQWLASSYEVENHQFEFDLTVAHDLLKNFSEQDFLHQLDSILQEGNVRVDMVRAGRNKGWSDDDIKYLQQKKGDLFGFHTIENAGHWVHIDALPELLTVMNE